jgi:hypothetical protein
MSSCKYSHQLTWYEQCGRTGKQMNNVQSGIVITSPLLAHGRVPLLGLILQRRPQWQLLFDGCIGGSGCV